MVKKGSSFTADVWQNAAILVDKPQDWTSFDVCGKLRGALKTKKACVLSSPVRWHYQGSHIWNLDNACCIEDGGSYSLNALGSAKCREGCSQDCLQNI